MLSTVTKSSPPLTLKHAVQFLTLIPRTAAPKGESTDRVT
jgi:hypothetical protein